jgi:hypothetical protein
MLESPAELEPQGALTPPALDREKGLVRRTWKDCGREN